MTWYVSKEMKYQSELSVLILQYNSADLTLQLLESIVEHESLNIGLYRIIVMDNASVDPKREEITRRFPFVEFVQYADNLGFAKAHNRIMDDVHEPWVLLLNNDCILQNNAIERLLQAAKRKKTSFATCEVFNDDGTPQNNYSYLPSPLRRVFIGFTGIGRLMKPLRQRMPAARVGYINGAVLLINTTVFLNVGGFDERYFMYREDFDLMLKLWACGYRGYRFRGGKIIHIGGGSAKRRYSQWELEQKYSGNWWLWYKDYYPPMQIKLFCCFELIVASIKKNSSDLWRYRYEAARNTLIRS